MTKKNIIKRSLAATAAAFAIMVPTTTEFGHAFISSPAIVMEASAASKTTRSGKSKAYISKIAYKKCAFTICVNTDAQINDMIKWLDSISNYTSGAKYSAKICDLGKKLVPGLKDKAILTFASSVFKNINGVGKSASAAKKQVQSLASKNKTKGIKLTVRENGAWIVELQ